MSVGKKIYVDLIETAGLIAVSTATLQRLVRTNAFPKPRQVSTKRVAWLLREVEAWAEARPVADQLPPPNTGRNRTSAPHEVLRTSPGKRFKTQA